MAWIISTGGRPRSHRPRLSSNDGSSFTASNAERIWSGLTVTRIGGHPSSEGWKVPRPRAGRRGLDIQRAVAAAGSASRRRRCCAGQRALGPDELGRRPLEDHPPAVVAGARAQVDHPVGAGDDVEVVLDDDHGPPGVDQPVEQADRGCRRPACGGRSSARRGRRPRCRRTSRSRASAAGARRPTACRAPGRARRSRGPTSARRSSMTRTGFSVKKSRASSTDIARTSTMFRPRRRYSRTSSVKRRPSQTSQMLTTSAMKPRLV